ncbi:hypothetical protein [Shinella oryzae]|uniref:Uncharacterized protein n=1 Tax=Shinella oryzae TaxID=2871820 RepID=A0ABY9K6A6_9HYPH|nr:hypothetical protein [Shinella oryzae]WLS04088.1 hypothetical protein Q9315_05555 [Shinella oryzae]
MMYLGGVTLGYFNLYPVGFQPKTEDTRSAGNSSEAEAADGTQETLPLEGSRLSSARRPVQWPTHVFF